jgi:hypothetical protein
MSKKLDPQLKEKDDKIKELEIQLDSQRNTRPQEQENNNITWLKKAMNDYVEKADKEIKIKDERISTLEREVFERESRLSAKVSVNPKDAELKRYALLIRELEEDIKNVRLKNEELEKFSDPSQMAFLEQTINVLQQEKKKVIDELSIAKEENDQLSNLLIEHSNKSTQVTSEL